jgi:hypothetical protein
VSPPGVIPGVIGLLVGEASKRSGQTTLVNDNPLFYLAECVTGLLGLVSESQSSRVHDLSTVTLIFASFVPLSLCLQNRISVLGIPDWATVFSRGSNSFGGITCRRGKEAKGF